MADLVFVELIIGGEIPRGLLAEILQLADDNELSLGYDIFPSLDNIPVFFDSFPKATHLVMHDNESRGIADLEAFLVRHGIPFDRYYPPDIDEVGSCLEFRPGSGACIERPCNENGKVLLYREKVCEFYDQIVQAAGNTVFDAIRFASVMKRFLEYIQPYKELPPFKIKEQETVLG